MDLPWRFSRWAVWEGWKSGRAACRWYRALARGDVQSSSRAADLIRAVSRLGLILIHPARHRRVALCLRHDRLAPLVSRQPQLPFKYLRRNYLASNFDRDQRARILAFHFDYIAAAVPAGAVRAVAVGGICLWTALASARMHQVRLAVPDPVDNEGELALEYVFDDQLIYILSFTFAPSSLFAAPGTAAILISRIQANGAETATLRQAAKDLGDIAPRHVLIFAMQGIALALKQNSAFAVSVANHTVSKTRFHAISPASYDDLFGSLGGVLEHDGIYHLPVPFRDHEPAQVSSSHRRRARHRRASKERITDQVRLAAAALFKPVGPLGDASGLTDGLGNAIRERASSPPG